MKRKKKFKGATAAIKSITIEGQAYDNPEYARLKSEPMYRYRSASPCTRVFLRHITRFITFVLDVHDRLDKTGKKQ